MKSKAFDITMFIVVLCLLLSSIKLAYADEVNPETWANNSEYVLYTLIVADMLQTRQIRDHDDLYEKNHQFCGRNPEDKCIAAWFGAKLLGVWWLNNYAGWDPMRRYKVNVFLSVWTGKAVHSNAQLGLQVKF